MTRGICLATNLFKMHSVSLIKSNMISITLHTDIIGSPKVKTELSFHKCKILLHFDMIQRSVWIESWTFANTMTNQNFMEFLHNPQYWAKIREITQNLKILVFAEKNRENHILIQMGFHEFFFC